MLIAKRKNLLGGTVMTVTLILVGVLAIPTGLLMGAIALLWGGADKLIKAIEG